MLNDKQLNKINWDKCHGLIPCIIQNIFSSEVLMHGYMTYEALLLTQSIKMVTLYSRKKKRLWTKGETSGHFLKVKHITLDCDHDSLLVLVDSINQTCHLNNYSCFSGYQSYYTKFFYLEKIIQNKSNSHQISSYTYNLHHQGINRIAQKVGEEAIETIIAAMEDNKKNFINESSDLIYHLLVLLHSKKLNFSDIITILCSRNNQV